MRFEYQARVNRVVDGDTVIMDVDLGFGVWLHAQSFRLLGCNARETSEEGGIEAGAHLATVLPVGTLVVLTSVKNDKYGGRYDALVELPSGQDLATLLVETGWAASWTGAGKKPVPHWPRNPGAALVTDAAPSTGPLASDAAPSRRRRHAATGPS